MLDLLVKVESSSVHTDPCPVPAWTIRKQPVLLKCSQVVISSEAPYTQKPGVVDVVLQERAVRRCSWKGPHLLASLTIPGLDQTSRVGRDRHFMLLVSNELRQRTLLGAAPQLFPLGAETVPSASLGL